MEKRRLEKLNISPSMLGLGCMRFPVNEEGKIDEPRAEAMIHQAMELGISYYDTAYVYHDGDSEPFTGKVLNKYPRESYYLATKMPVWLVDTYEKGIEVFQEQLDRVQKDYIDFYLLHALNIEAYRRIKALGIVDLCEQLKAEGKIKYLGFSFHDSYEAFEEIIEDHNWDFCQIQLNYMDTEFQAGLKGYNLATKLDIPVIVMEPVRGGSLASFSDDISQMFRDINDKYSLAGHALRWVGTLPNVNVILSGMSTEEQLAENIHTFTNFEPLTEAEEKGINHIAQVLHNRVKNKCTNCRYCMPCPVGVDIPGNFRLWNNYAIYQKYNAVQWAWENMPSEQKGEACVKCGKCEEVCPQQIAIRKDLELSQKELDANRV